MNFDFETLLSELPPELAELIGSFMFVPALIVVIAGIALALWGTRLFKICITLVGTVFFGILGSSVVAPMLIEAMGEAAAELPFSLSSVIGFVFAGLGYLLSYKLYKFAIFLFGGAIGFGLGTIVAGMISAGNTDSEFFTSEVFFIIVSVVCAILVGLITLFIFKFLYILATSFSGMFAASMGACFAITPSMEIASLAIFGIIGFVLSIVAMVFQYKHTTDM